MYPVQSNSPTRNTGLNCQLTSELTSIVWIDQKGRAYNSFFICRNMQSYLFWLNSCPAASPPPFFSLSFLLLSLTCTERIKIEVTKIKHLQYVLVRVLEAKIFILPFYFWFVVLV